MCDHCQYKQCLVPSPKCPFEAAEQIPQQALQDCRNQPLQKEEILTRIKQSCMGLWMFRRKLQILPEELHSPANRKNRKSE